MPVFEIDPLSDSRWKSFVAGHADGSIFHTAGWLEALRDAYGFEPAALTTSPEGAPLECGLVLCRVRSALTGSRLISLPFSDHCEPLVTQPGQLEELLEATRAIAEQGWRYCEIRGRSIIAGSGFEMSRDALTLHVLDLSPTSEELFDGLHASSIRRKVRRAKREHLHIERGLDDRVLMDFYELQIETRRRHRRPPQPLAWFRALRDRLGKEMSIRVAYQNSAPTASIVTFESGSTMTYKYGASRRALSPLGGMPLLLWDAISEASERGFRSFDFGRTDDFNQGLMTFKDRFGASRHKLSYLRWPRAAAAGPGRLEVAAGHFFSVLPNFLLRGVGSVLYRHAA